MAAKLRFCTDSGQSGPFGGALLRLPALALATGGAVYAANNSVQGAKKDDNAFDGDARPRS
jgi:hypothetical protein